MDCIKLGKLIYKLRHEKSMTQKQLADKMNISDKTISKWERGLGCPDVSLLSELSELLDVSIEKLLKGDLQTNDLVGGNMKNSNYYVCPICGNVTICTGNATVSCCGRKLEALKAQKAEKQKQCDGKIQLYQNEDEHEHLKEKLEIEEIENDWYITSTHPMTKEHYISFVAFATGDRVQIIKQYPEWDLQVRIPRRGHGMLLWYCMKEGLFYQVI